MPLPMPQDRASANMMSPSQVQASAEARNQRRMKGRGFLKPKEVLDLAAAAGSLQVVLTWSAPVTNTPYPITDYVVEYKESTDSAWIVFADGVSASTGATVTGLTASTAYDFRVAAVNSAGQGRYSAPVTETPTA